MRPGIACVWIALGFVALFEVAQQHSQAKQLERGKYEHLHYGNFKEFVRHTLNISQVLDTLHVTNYIDCAFECLTNVACFSFNFALVADINSGLHACLLLASDKYNYSNSFKSSEEFSHYAIGTPCESFPCRNGGTCRPLYGKSSYVCDCLEGSNGTHCEKGWLKITAVPVCFGAKNDSYGTFIIQKPGEIFALKLVHLSGYVACATGSAATKWGCEKQLNTHITDANNLRLFPKKGSTIFDQYLAYSSGFSYNSNELVFLFLSSPLSVTAGQEFRVWYGEDLINNAEENNIGRSCINVYGWN